MLSNQDEFIEMPECWYGYEVHFDPHVSRKALKLSYNFIMLERL